jgi:NAD(P)-dependent dehydrogenase (short-subunit alcohol dehydrogenase family)
VSAGDNKLGGWYSYRGSKAALNQMTKTMSLEVARRKHKVACILLHPGTTETGLSEPFQKVRILSEGRGVSAMLVPWVHSLRPIALTNSLDCASCRM